MKNRSENQNDFPVENPKRFSGQDEKPVQKTGRGLTGKDFETGFFYLLIAITVPALAFVLIVVGVAMINALGWLISQAPGWAVIIGTALILTYAGCVATARRDRLNEVDQ